ncbi:MAG: tRNA pseudouridine(55) synthase TruB [Tissierellaceae bacterium]
MNGVINIFKPRGMTSHDVVSFLRRKLKIKKIGHAGTLDPNASGVLPLCIGKGTKIAEFLLDLDKEYISEVTLGTRTDTQDMDGRVLAISDKKVKDDDIIEIMAKYRGELLQVPPMYSALKHKGKKLYQLAREGKVVPREARKITIYKQEILKIDNSRKILFYTRCSKGTYIRSLCDNIGSDLGTYGYMSFLMRTGVGNFKIENAYGLSYLENLSLDEISKILIPIDEAIDYIPYYAVDDIFYNNLINGNLIKVDPTDSNIVGKLQRIYCRETFIGLGRINEIDSDYFLKMEKVLVI